MAIKIDTFLNELLDIHEFDDINKYVKTHIIKEYVPYEKKADIAKAIVDNCYWRTVTDVNGNKHKELHVDSVAKHMLFCMSVIKLFTDIECQYGDGKMLEDFNALNRPGVIDIIMQNINEREINEFRMLVQLTCDDVMTNEFENHAFIIKQVNRFGELVGTAIAPFVSQLDVDKIKEVINNIS